VIVHELLHLRYPSHGRMFKALMSAHVPGWRNLECTRKNRHASSERAVILDS
jgi:predicted metal-dependent hydrolase